MKAKCLDVTRCAGTGHTIFKLLINDSTNRYYCEEMSKIISYIDGLENREILLILIYSTVKKAGATTPAQIKAALLNQEWEF
jgi:hypothetical protein